ncbi:MAG TPA: glycosyltransferase family 2 protein [Anaerolineales bacterium]|nr:glycosyltransferase family 2 protein [Anaerolineales bacterium]
MGPVVSVVVINWNGERFLQRCLGGLEAQTLTDFETIVVDNASTDGSVAQIRANWPNTRLVCLEQNLGFAAANNLGAQLAQGNWLALLNNDAFPAEDWLERLLEAAGSHPEFTSFASHLVQALDPARTDGAGDIYHASGYAWHRHLNQPVELSSVGPIEVFSPCGAAALYAREAFLQTGGFDERYFSHQEDIDLGFRLRLQGYRCLYVPAARVEHIGSASFGKESPQTVYQVQRNTVWTYVKDMPTGLFWKYLLAHLVANLVFLLHYTLRGQARPAWRAKFDALRALPAVLSDRRKVQSSRRVGSEEIERLIDRSWLGPYLLGNRAGKIKRAARHLGLDRSG